MRRTFVAGAAVALVLGACQPTESAVPVASAPVARSLAVIVSGPGGQSVEGATVCAVTVGGRAERCERSTSAGTARLAVRPGTYFLQVTPAAGSRLGPGRGWADATSADITAVIALEQRSKIAGTVRTDSGAAVSGADVCAHAMVAGPSPTCARTGPQGAYEIEVRSDLYKLEVNGPPTGRLIPQWARDRLGSASADVIDVRTQDAGGVDVVLRRGLVLSGIIRGPGGPVEDAQVCLRPLAAPLPWDCERTRKNGAYTSLLEPGRYYMWVVPPDNVRLVARWYDHVLEGVDAAVLNVDRDRSVDMSLEPGPQLRGRVVTTEGEPVAALVCVDTPFPTGRICRPTGGDGSYQVTTRPETYVVEVVPQLSSDLIKEYWLRKRAWNDADQIVLGNTDRTLDLTVRRGARLTGVIRDTRGVPLEAATLNIVDDVGELVGTDTDIGGTYVLVVPNGSYQIEVFAPLRGERGDYLSQPRRDITVNGFTRYDVVLEDANP